MAMAIELTGSVTNGRSEKLKTSEVGGGVGMTGCGGGDNKEQAVAPKTMSRPSRAIHRAKTQITSLRYRVTLLQ
jgi:hypothetical protein